LHHAAAKLRQQVDQQQLPGFLALVIQDGKVIFSDQHGVADLCTDAELRFDTLVRLYSQTKPITITGFMLLWEQGLVALDEPVSKYIPEFKSVKVRSRRGALSAPSRPICVHDLLAHTSGIGFGAGFGYEPENEYERTYSKLVRKVDAAELDSVGHWCTGLAKLPLQFHPGQDWGYGYSSDVLGRIIEVVSNRPLDEYLKTEVLQPLGMHDTDFIVPKKKQSRLAALYKRDPWDGQASKVTFFTCDPGGSCRLSASNRNVVQDGLLLRGKSSSASAFCEKGLASKVLQGGGCVGSVAGGLVSTLNDWARFGQMLLNHGELDGFQLLKPSTVKLLARDWLNDFTPSSRKRRSPLWVWGTPGIGFSPLGQIGVRYAGAKGRRCVGAAVDTVHWGGAGGSGYMLCWPQKLLVLTYTGCAFDTATQKLMWSAARRAVGSSKLRPKALSKAALAASTDRKRCSPQGGKGPSKRRRTNY